jgi:type VI secretion system secreted protein Hcp
MAVDMYLKMSDIKGESSDSKHKGEIDVLSFHWGVTQQGTAGRGGGGGAGKAQVSDFSIVKKYDAASPVLFQKCCTGEHIKEALFTARKAGGAQLEYLKIKLSDVLISSVRPGASAHGADDVPMEEVGMNFAKCEIDYQPQGPDGKAAGGPIHGGWDVGQNVKA